MSRFSCRLYGVNSKSPHEAPADAERGLRIRRLARSGASRTDASGVRIRYDAPAHIAHAALRQYPCPPPPHTHPPSAIRSCTLLTSNYREYQAHCLSKACISCMISFRRYEKRQRARYHHAFEFEHEQASSSTAGGKASSRAPVPRRVHGRAGVRGARYLWKIPGSCPGVSCDACEASSVGDHRSRS